MPLNGSDRGSRADRGAPATTIAYTATARRVPLIRAGRIVRRCWRRSQAEKTALAYREAGYAVVVSEVPRDWSAHELRRYAVVVSEKTAGTLENGMSSFARRAPVPQSSPQGAAITR
jgi:hypothetical protein